MEVNYSRQLMSLLQVFPNCPSVLHPNVFMSLFLLISFQHPFSKFLSFLLPSAHTALPLSQLDVSITTKFSFPQTRRVYPSNYMWDCLSVYSELLVLVRDFKSHKGWCQNDGHTLTCCQICHSFLHLSRHHHHRLSASSL